MALVSMLERKMWMLCNGGRRIKRKEKNRSRKCKTLSQIKPDTLNALHGLFFTAKNKNLCELVGNFSFFMKYLQRSFYYYQILQNYNLYLI